MYPIATIAAAKGIGHCFEESGRQGNGSCLRVRRNVDEQALEPPIPTDTLNRLTAFVLPVDQSPVAQHAHLPPCDVVVAERRPGFRGPCDTMLGELSLELEHVVSQLPDCPVEITGETSERFRQAAVEKLRH